jgi:hypothetical protein
MKEIKYSILYCVNYCDSIFLWFRNRTTVPVPLRQKVTVPTVPVPQQ